MSSWGNNDNAANAPYWAVNSTIVHTPDVSTKYAKASAANVALLYGNTTPSVYIAGETIGLFMVDSGEAVSGGSTVTDVSIIQGGSGYVEAPSVSFSGGGGSSAAATAYISGGAVTNIQVTNTGSSYETVPTVVIQLPVLTVPTSAVTAAANTITYAGHSQANSAALIFHKGGGSVIGGLVDNTTYYVIPVNSSTIKLATSAANAGAGIEIDLTDQGSSGQYFEIVNGVRATAIADKGLGEGDTVNSSSKSATHTGWNMKVTGTGGRAGRVQWETLVATSDVIGDGADDITLPDA